MSNSDPVIQTLLDDHVRTRLEERPDWADVLHRAESEELRNTAGGGGFRRRRFFAVAAIAFGALLVPLIALATSESWWFTRTPGAPKPEGTVVVVKADSWNGVPWALTAYRSEGNVCFGLTPNWRKENGGSGAALACGVPLRGLAPQPQTSPKLHWIAFVNGAANESFPNWIAGPTASQVAEVDIVLSSGKTISTATFGAPSELGLNLNFYATPLPCNDELRALIPKDAAGRAFEEWRIRSFGQPMHAPCASGG